MSGWRRRAADSDDDSDSEELVIERNDAPAAQTAAAKPKGTAAGGGAVLAMLEGQFGDLNRRGRVALELLTTERVYCECLTSTINAFLIPLRTGLCPTFDRRYLPTLFVNIDKILAANTKFLHEIEYLVFSPKFNGDVAMDGALAPLVPALQLYPEYVKNHYRAIMLVNQLQSKDTEFKAFLVRAKECSDAKLDLLACLIAPVQRVPRYRLLLEELVRHTRADAPDRAGLERVHGIVCALAERVNADMRRQENLQQQVRVLGAFVGAAPPVAPSLERTLLHHGPLARRVRTGTLKTRWFFLFSDCLVYGRPSSVAGAFAHEPFEGHLYTLSQVLHHAAARETPAQTGTAEFEVVAQEKSFTCVAADARDKQAWLDAFARLAPERGAAPHAPVWVADTDAGACMLCGQRFTLTIRRHHCRACGVVVCGECSQTRARLPATGAAMVRVCDKCAETLGGRKARAATLHRANQSFHRLFSKLGPSSHDASSTNSPSAASSASSSPRPKQQQQQQQVSQQQPQPQQQQQQHSPLAAPSASASTAPAPAAEAKDSSSSSSDDDSDSDSDSDRDNPFYVGPAEESSSSAPEQPQEQKQAPQPQPAPLLDFGDLTQQQQGQQEHADPFSGAAPETGHDEKLSATDLLLGESDYSAVDLLTLGHDADRGMAGQVSTRELLGFLQSAKERAGDPEPPADATGTGTGTGTGTEVCGVPIADDEYVVDEPAFDFGPASTTASATDTDAAAAAAAATDATAPATAAATTDATATADAAAQDAEDPFADPFAGSGSGDGGGAGHDSDDDNPFAVGPEDGASSSSSSTAAAADADDPFADVVRAAPSGAPQAPDSSNSSSADDDADNPFRI